MAHNNIEIEIKLPLQNPDGVKQFLDERAELQARDVFQRDTYYVPAHRNFLAEQYPFEWLRLRETKKGASINYKHFYPERAEKTDYCDEFESNIENVEAMKKIFASLNITAAVVVEKVRNTWMFQGVEIAIDDVKDLGSYIELEATTGFDDPNEAKQMLYATLEQLRAQVGEEELRGYPYRILELQKGNV